MKYLRTRRLKPLPTPIKSWAERHAPLAQVIGAYSTVAAVLIAGLGYWYTVIPLYQKAAVDEQLARREAELRRLDAELARTKQHSYELVRRGLLEQTATRASYDCAAFWRHSEDSPMAYINQSLVPCLTRASETLVTKKALTDEDSRRLMEATKIFSTDLEQRRISTLEEIENIKIVAASNPSILAPDGEFTLRMQELLDRYDNYRSAEDRKKQQRRRHEQRVTHTQYLMALEFSTKANSEILKFYRSGIWPAKELVQ